MGQIGKKQERNRRRSWDLEFTHPFIQQFLDIPIPLCLYSLPHSAVLKHPVRVMHRSIGTGQTIEEHGILEKEFIWFTSS